MVAHSELQLFRRDVRRGDEGAGGSRAQLLDAASLKVVDDRSEEQIISRLLDLENDEQSERRVRLSGERYLSLLTDPDNGRSYVFRHSAEDVEGDENPDEAEFYEYDKIDVARQAFNQLLGEARRAGHVVEDDSTDDLGDIESSGAELRDLYADQDEDELTQDATTGEDEE